MKLIDRRDIIFATIVCRGRALASLTLSGMETMADILRRVRESIDASTRGIITLRLRNYTQGWLQERSLVMR